MKKGRNRKVREKLSRGTLDDFFELLNKDRNKWTRKQNLTDQTVITIRVTVSYN